MAERPLNIKDVKDCAFGQSQLGKSFKERLKDIGGAILGAIGDAISNLIAPITGAIDQLFSLKDSIKTKLATAKSDLEAAHQEAEDDFASRLQSRTDAALACLEEKAEMEVAMTAGEAAAEHDSPPAIPTKGASQKDLQIPEDNYTQEEGGEGASPGKYALSVAQQLGWADTIGTLSDVDEQLANSGIPEQREARRLYANINPTLKADVESLEYFQPLSNHIGASVLAYTPDKPSMYLKYWAGNFGGTVSEGLIRPYALRKTLRHKIDDESYLMHEQAYLDLCGGFVRCLPNEFEEARISNGNEVFDPETAINFHIAGDVYASMTLYGSDTRENVKTELKDALGDAYNLIDYLFPINEDITIENSFFLTEQDGQNMVIDSKGNRVVAKYDTPVDSVIWDVDTT